MARRKKRDKIVRSTRRVVVATIGGAVTLVGLVLIVTPGPALLVIPAGLAILATEFPWARRLQHRVNARISATVAQARRARSDRRAARSRPARVLR